MKPCQLGSLGAVENHIPRSRLGGMTFLQRLLFEGQHSLCRWIPHAYHMVHGESQGIALTTSWVPLGLYDSATSVVTLVWQISSSGQLLKALEAQKRR